jgi:hypothetical protein
MDFHESSYVEGNRSPSPLFGLRGNLLGTWQRSSFSPTPARPFLGIKSHRHTTRHPLDTSCNTDGIPVIGGDLQGNSL